MQERYENFLPYIMKYGDEFIAILIENLNPLDNRFIVLEEE
jgi:hypothetical protein